MDPVLVLSVVSRVIAFVSTGQAVYQRVADISLSESRRQRALLQSRYGWSVAFAVTFFSRDTAIRYERVERDILNGSAEGALAFKQAITDECNMTAVAVSRRRLLLLSVLTILQGAIVAQVAITALSLPNLSTTHWVARAFFLLAVVSGCLSVYYACYLQRIVGTLFQPDGIKDWLRFPPSRQAEDPDPFRASLAAVLIVSAPFNMMKVSIFAFLIGLSIYQGFTWTRALDTSAGEGDSRNVFITLLVGTGIGFGFFFFTFATKSMENLLRTARTKDHSYDPVTVRPDKHEDPGLVRSQQPPVLLGNPSIHPRHSVDGVVVGDLTAALDAASQAHLQCAEADRRVALEFAKISEST